MAISLINVGNIANDGTGDDLREAFIKVNQNFEELDLRQPEATTASNRGSVGEGIFAEKVDFDLQFKRIVAGNNITLASGNNTVTVSALGGLQNLSVVGDAGSASLADGDVLTIQGGTLTSTQVDSATNTLLINAVTSLAADSDPQLSATLNAQNNSIVNVNALTVDNVAVSNTVTSNSFVGPLQGLVFGVDVRELTSPFEQLDFGSFTNNVTSWIDYLLFTTEVDLGTIADPAEISIDLGSF
jgi:hypothetical protein